MSSEGRDFAMRSSYTKNYKKPSRCDVVELRLSFTQFGNRSDVFLLLILQRILAMFQRDVFIANVSVMLSTLTRLEMSCQASVCVCVYSSDSWGFYTGQ
jgi:hypothetical protein